MSGALRRVALAGSGAVAARGLVGVLAAGPAGRSTHWRARNFRGQPVSLLGGPAAVLAASAVAAGTSAPPRLRLALVAAGCGAAAVGRYDDRFGAPSARGLAGHLDAFFSGRNSTGVVKIFGIGASGLAAGALARPAVVDAVLAGGVVAGTANLVNLLDLRPGRALKAVLLVAGPACLWPGGAELLVGPLGAAAGVLATDLAEQTMLGDTGANGLGAMVGLGLAAGAGRARLAALLGVLAALTAASEAVSFSAVIDRVPALRRVDRLGARPRPG